MTAQPFLPTCSRIIPYPAARAGSNVFLGIFGNLEKTAACPEAAERGLAEGLIASGDHDRLTEMLRGCRSNRPAALLDTSQAILPGLRIYWLPG